MLDGCRITIGNRYSLEHHFTTLRWSIYNTDCCSLTSRSMLAEEERFLYVFQIPITQACKTGQGDWLCVIYNFGFGGYYNKFECKNHRHFGLSLSGFLSSMPDQWCRVAAFLIIFIFLGQIVYCITHVSLGAKLRSSIRQLIPGLMHIVQCHITC